MKKTLKREIVFDANDVAKIAFGEHNINLKKIADTFGVTIGSRGNRVFILGDEKSVRQAERAVTELYLKAEKGSGGSLVEMVSLSEKAGTQLRKEITENNTVISTRTGRRIEPRSPNQARYVQAMLQHDIVFAIGPAGTGKTYLAVAMAVRFLRERLVNRIVLTRPAVEAGEKLGFLPGDITEKVNPYLRPIYDSLNDILSRNEFFSLMERSIIEIAPLAFMRGRTLNDAFVILDEAQNTTKEQMKMFLTRIGFNTRAVITGDITQIDLSEREKSGLLHARKTLKHIRDIAFIELTEEDVVRHPLVQQIIRAYEEAEKQD